MMSCWRCGSHGLIWKARHTITTNGIKTVKATGRCVRCEAMVVRTLDPPPARTAPADLAPADRSQCGPHAD